MTAHTTGHSTGVELRSPGLTSEDDDFICETCHRIDFRGLLANPRQAKRPSETTAPSPHTMRYSSGCKLCCLMFQGVPQNDMEKTFELRSFSFRQMSYWATETNCNAQDTILLKIGLQKPGGFFDYPPDDVFCKLSSDDSEGSCCCQPVQKIWDSAKARSWLTTCAKCHESVCRQDIPQILGMNLIDCEGMVVVKAAQEMRWLTLSYVWGISLETEDHAGYRSGSRMPLDIPRTVRDAISVTLQLGYRYLWVDEYCINQNDDNHRNDQITRMDQIYLGAELTIVAAAGENKFHGLPGVGSTKREASKIIRVGDVVVFSNGPEPYNQIDQSRWFTRAWTFQEGFLSRRVLAFTEHQMSFYCSASSWMEGLTDPDSSGVHQVDENRRPDHFFDTFSFLPSPVWNWNHFASMLETYSERRITKETDTLNAVLGVLNHIRRLRPSAKQLCGLPFFRTSGETSRVTLMDTFEEILSAALSWHSCVGTSNNRPQRQPAFPSWTWAGWSGGAEFWIRSIREARHQPFLRHARLESSSGQIVLSSAHDTDIVQHELDTVTLIQFEAPTIPATTMSVTEVESVDTDSDDSSYMGSRSLRVAGRPIYGHNFRDQHAFDQLVENVGRGVWSCFILSAGRCSKEDEDEEYSRFVLTVCWKADQTTAERIGSFYIYVDPSENVGFGAAEDEGWTWRCVRLI